MKIKIRFNFKIKLLRKPKIIELYVRPICILYSHAVLLPMIDVLRKKLLYFVLKGEVKDILGAGDTNCLHCNTEYFFPKPNFAHGFDFSVLG